MDTLLLNKDAAPLSMIPLSTASWQNAITYLWMDRVTVLEWYDDWIVRSEQWETRVPAVIMFKKFIKRNMRPRFSKYNIMLRDRFKCQYCGTSVDRATVSMDHVIPVSLGGDTSWHNIVCSCMPCNTRKGSKLIQPNRRPYRPSYYDLAGSRKELGFEAKHPSWQEYLQ